MPAPPRKSLLESALMATKLKNVQSYQGERIHKQYLGGEQANLCETIKSAP